MNKKIGILVVVVVLIIAGIFAFSPDKMDKTNGNPENVDRQKVDVVDAVSTLTASFVCPDKTEFTAEFPTESEVTILVGGKQVRSLSYVASKTLTFDGPGYIYSFEGEVVVVTDKATKKKVTCTQVVDGKNAPVNFGDTTSGKQDPATIVKASIQGNWVGADDATKSIAFELNGTTIDKSGATAVSGVWTVFAGTKAPKVPFTVDKSLVYIQIKGSGTAPTVYYKVGEIEADMLILLTVDKDEVRAFTKVK